MIGILFLIAILIGFFAIAKPDLDRADESIKEMEKSLPPEVILANAPVGCATEIFRWILWAIIAFVVFLLVVSILVHGFNIDRL